jgi:hypothetical protein
MSKVLYGMVIAFYTVSLIGAFALAGCSVADKIERDKIKADAKQVLEFPNLK